MKEWKNKHHYNGQGGGKPTDIDQGGLQIYIQQMNK